MFIKAPKQQNIIKIPEYFITLKKITENNDLHFSLIYQIDQSDVVRKSAHKCKITATSRVVKKRDIVIDNNWPQIDNKTVIKNVLSMLSSERASAKNQELFIINSVFVDHTSAVNNQIISPLRSGKPISEIPQLKKSKISVKTIGELNQTNNIYPILQVNPTQIEDDDTSPPTHHTFQLGIINQAIDPTHIYDYEDDILDPQESIQGVYNKFGNRSMSQLPQTQKQLVETFKSITRAYQNPGTITSIPYNDDVKILTLTTELSNQVDIESTLILSSDKILDENGNYKDVYIQFDVLDSNDLTIQTQQEKVDILQHIDVYYMPKLAPIASFSKYETMSTGNIKVRQIDETAKGIRLFRKNLSYASNVIDSYTFINDFPLTSDHGSDNIAVDVSSKNTVIYRLIPIGEHDTLGSEFVNVIVNPSKTNKKFTYVSLAAQIINVGVNIEVRELPPEVVAFRIMRRDTTIYETEFAIIGDDNIKVNLQDSNALYVVVDNSVKNEHVYEYVCKLIYKNGSETQSGNTIIEYVTLTENLVETKIENLEINYDINNLDVKFTLNTTIFDTQLDTIKNLLIKQGIEEHFINDLTLERDKLRQLIAHQVQRINQTIGVRENFGTITTETFSDSTLRGINSVSPLQIGHKYRYEVVTCLRSAETLFENFNKESIDKITNKPYVYSPNKFLHPIALSKGNLTNPITLNSNHTKDQMAFGNVGNLSQIDVSFSENITGIVQSSVEKFDREHLLIKWNVNGNPGNVDHFIIMKEHLGQRKIIGKSHASFERTNFTFVYHQDTFDVGELFFIVQPMYNSYMLGSIAKTNGITL